MIVVVATVVGVAIFARGAREIVRTVRVGRAAGGRWTPVGPRLATLTREVLGHGRFQHRPVVKVAHWVVMVSFPLLFLTLVTGYGQVVDPAFTLPLIGHLPAAGVGDRGDRVAVAGRHRGADRAADPAAAPGTGGSRFFGSNQGQAFFVEATVLAVVLCVILLRGLEYALYSGRRVALPADRLVRGVVDRGRAGDAGERDRRRRDREDRRVDVVVRRRRPAAHDGRRVAPVPRRRQRVRAARPARRGRPRSPPADDDRRRQPVDLAALEDLPDDARLGVGAIEDFTWKGLLDFSTCTECGRCQDQCPAWATGKPLCPEAGHARAAGPRRGDGPVPAGGLVPTSHRPRPARRPASSTPTPSGPAPAAARACSSAPSTSSTSTRSSTCGATRCSWSRRSPRSWAARSPSWSGRATRGGCRRATG